MLLSTMNRVSQMKILSMAGNGHITYSNELLNKTAYVKVLRAMKMQTQLAKPMGPTWGLPGSCRPQMGPMLAP